MGFRPVYKDKWDAIKHHVRFIKSDLEKAERGLDKFPSRSKALSCIRDAKHSIQFLEKELDNGCS